MHSAFAVEEVFALKKQGHRISFWGFFARVLSTNWNLDCCTLRTGEGDQLLSKAHNSNKRMIPANSFFFALVVSRIGGRRRVPWIHDDETNQANWTTRNLKSSFFLLFFRLIAGAIDRNLNITIFAYVRMTALWKNFFPFELSEGWIFLKINISDIANSLLNLAEAKFYEVGLAVPCLSWVLQALNHARYPATPPVIAYALCWSARKYYRFEPP